MNHSDGISKTPKASVIVPTFQDWDKVCQCLQHLKKQDLPSSDFEVIVADNNIEGESPKDLQIAANVRIVKAIKPGSYAARNVALSIAKGDVIFFTDADCRPEADWLLEGLRALEGEEGTKRVAGQIMVVPTSGRWNGWSLYDRVFHLRQENYAKRGFAATANLAVERSVFEVVGVFNETSFSGGDKEWNMRATAADVPMHYQDSMKVLHPARATFASLAQKRRRLAGAQFVAKAGRPISRCIPRVRLFLPSVSAYLTILKEPVDVPLCLRVRAMWNHYLLGWVHNIEIIRLGIFGQNLER